MFNSRHKQSAVSLFHGFFIPFFFSFPSLICFFTLALQLKVMLLFQMSLCYMENRQEEYFIENMKICQHADIIMAAQII